MRVLHLGKFYLPHRGGMEEHLHVLCQALQGSVTLQVVVASEGRNRSEEVIGGVRVTRVPAALTAASTSICPAMIREIRAFRPDIVHIHHPNPAAMMCFLASGVRSELIVSYHSDIVRQKVLGRICSPILRQALGRCRRVIAASPQLRDHSPVLSRYTNKCEIVPYGIDVSFLNDSNPAETIALRKRYGPRIVLAVGRHVYYKGFEVLIRAMRGVNGVLLLAGAGPLTGALREEARACNVVERVVFLGEVKNLAPLYHAADVFVLPSIAPSEAFGLVQLEAMACGKPVVNTNLRSGAPYVSQHGVTGITVPSSDAHSLSSAIRTLLDNPQLADRYGTAGRVRARRHFSVEAMGHRTLEIYKEAIQ